MIASYRAKHIRTLRNIKGFRHCRSHTGKPLQAMAYWQTQQEEAKLASRLWHHHRGRGVTICHRCFMDSRTKIR